MVAKEKNLYTFEEYEALEHAEGIRYAYYNGEVVAMAGTTKRYNLLVQSLSRLLYPMARRNGCQVFTENVKQKLTFGQQYVYPDLIYTCDAADMADDSATIVHSPSLLIEVLSKSTQDEDAHEKRLNYFKLPSLLVYVMISQADYRAEVYERNADFWKFRIIEGPDTVIYLETLDVTLAMRDIYEGL